MPTDATIPPSVLPALRTIAAAAGRAIMPFYTDDVEARRKDDGSPVTAADAAAEAVILPALRDLMPGVPIISEEAHAAGDRPDIGACFWLVDPLDGTKEFLKRNGEFTVNIALIRDGAPVLGVVHLPATGEGYWGHVGHGAWREAAPGDVRAIRVRPRPAAAPVALCSRSHADKPALDAFLAPWPDCVRLAAGSSLKFCRIAEGVADLYPRLGPTMEWDTAAGQAVLEAAGGRVEEMNGQPLRYGKAGFRNPHFLARGG